MRNARQTVLPAELCDALQVVGVALANRAPFGGELEQALRLMDDLPASVVVRAAEEIPRRANLESRHAHMSRRVAFPGWATTEFQQLKHISGLEYLFLFHRNGYLRQASLDKIEDPLPSAFLFSAVAWRLNDWVPDVRQAAKRCASRIFPLTPGTVIAAAALGLLTREASWGRWGDEREILEQAFSRPDVAHHLSELLVKRETGPLGRILQQALRNPNLDPYLPTIAANAAQPAVRGAAFKALVDGFASWPEGWAWEWVDKTYGLRRRIRTFGQRPLTQRMPAEQAIRLAIADKSAWVRKLALDALIRHRRKIPEATTIAEALSMDPNPGVQERANFVIKVSAAD